MPAPSNSINDRNKAEVGQETNGRLPVFPRSRTQAQGSPWSKSIAQSTQSPEISQVKFAHPGCRLATELRYDIKRRVMNTVSDPQRSKSD